ncbi:efflux RND transporter permease subunit [Uliginosibacterium aquaticum]|uniref:Efflux pump membrane transporter n=1 Tax=Uliginosibacterium aquaticum TaxID=2731212 RepID=A0ABX2ILZ8_9RHOO|nr:efflux RND transporter permease subunit [Uliginosibacterium aquaticum]NSL55704.1 efflux RND transporter permease subunit [Uliginosibacterium aquaticum]
MSRFFIDRPIFAWVIAIVIMLAGAGAISQLSLEQYPDISPTRISIKTTYPGASAETIENSVTQVIEQQMTGLDHLTYISSKSQSDGSARVELSFEAGTDPDVAQMQVQNKLQQAESQLPDAVQDQGLTVTKSSSDFMLMLNLISEDPAITSTDIANYIATSLKDTLSRIDGVGEAQALGSGYAMRIWLDPAKMQKYALMPSDISSALSAQNTEVSAGQVGALPAAEGQSLNATITARSKLKSVDQFARVIIKSAADGAVVRLSDVARIELGRESYTVSTRYNGHPSAGLGITLASGANALKVAAAVKAKIAELQPFFPDKMQAVVAYDTTPFVKISIEEVVKTLLEALALVVLIMYLFMQNLRATLIPAVAVPVVLLGTFGVLAAFGYSINTLTMFGLVLAIGLLVDDAIVVVENVERIMSEEGLSPREATQKSMGQITGALIGISLVLSAVFIPMAFFGGSTGVIYRQFTITIVSAMVLSVVVALTLTPALCATLLEAIPQGGHVSHKGWLGRFFGGFNKGFLQGSEGCRTGVAGLLGRRGLGVLAYLLLVALTALLFKVLPTSFLPDEDQGTLMAQLKLPAGSTNERLMKSLTSFEHYLSQQSEVKAYMTVTGIDGDQASARAFIMLKDWSERTAKGQDAASLVRRYSQELGTELHDATVFMLQPPAVRGLGSNSGFDVQLQDLGGLGHEALTAARDQFLRLARQSKLLAQTRSNNLDDTPQLQVDIDDAKAVAQRLSAGDVNSTLSYAMGGKYVNDFIHDGRIKKVYLQADAAFRMSPDSVQNWFVRNANDDMVPFSAFSAAHWSYGSPQLTRYNGLSSFELVGDPARGVSSGTAMAEVERIVAQLPRGIGYEWTGASYQERLSGQQAPLLYAVSILFVFLCLAALYESWSVPFSVVLVVPLGVLGAVFASWLAGQHNDVYFQVGLLTTVGLSAKNAILIVEFAKTLEEQGMRLIDATLEALRLRLRPIIMTSLAFMFGVLPLALSTGAGSASRRAIGVGVLGGMVSATLLGVFFIPLFYVLVRSIFKRRAPATAPAEIAS